MKILVLSDKFKGSISSIEIGKTIKEIFKERNIIVDYFPISDGGNGFLESINYKHEYQKIILDTYDHNDDFIKTYYYLKNDVAFIESALIVGNKIKDNHDILKATSKGIGKAIIDAYKHGAKKIYIGLGGTLTNDGGKGMLEALGFNFDDDISYKEIIPLKEMKIICISDVSNPLLGKTGATYVFAKQKGADDSLLPILEKRMVDFANKITKYKRKNYTNVNGAGAAGGLGFALISMLNAKIENGLNFILDYFKIDDIVNDYDYIITGEGKIDKQSLLGKVVFNIANRYKNNKIIAICGINELCFDKYNNIIKIYDIVPSLTCKENSLKEPLKYLSLLIRQIIID